MFKCPLGTLTLKRPDKERSPNIVQHSFTLMSKLLHYYSEVKCPGSRGRDHEYSALCSTFNAVQWSATFAGAGGLQSRLGDNETESVWMPEHGSAHAPLLIQRSAQHRGSAASIIDIHCSRRLLAASAAALTGTGPVIGYSRSLQVSVLQCFSSETCKFET